MATSLKPRSFRKRSIFLVLKAFGWFFASTIIWFIIFAALFVIENKNTHARTSGAHTTEHFTVVYIDLPVQNAEYLAQNLERNRKAVLKDLGDPAMPHVIIKLYPEDHQEFKDERGGLAPEKTGGFVRLGELDTFYLQWQVTEDQFQNFLYRGTYSDNVVRSGQHEFAHLVIHNVLYAKALAAGNVRSRADWSRQCMSGYYSFCRFPQWLNESIAQYEADMISRDIFEEYPGNEDTLMPTQFSRDEWYTFGAIVGEYLVEREGADAIEVVVKARGDLGEAFGISDEEFNAGFRAYTKKRFAELYEKHYEE